jgi:membrane protease YdiL (CAAX protease family)
MPDPKQSFILMSQAAGMLALAAGLIAFVLYRVAGKGSLLPRQSAWQVPWSGWGVLVAFLAMVIVPSLIQLILTESGFYRSLYGPDFPRTSVPEKENQKAIDELTQEQCKLDPDRRLNEQEFKKEVAKRVQKWKENEQRQATHLRALWGQTLAAPLIVILLLYGFHYGFKASPEHMGLSRKRLGANVALGYVGWLVIAPLSFLAFAVAIILLTPNPDKHPLMDLGVHAGQLELAIFALQAAILWPIVEELVFRGILLAWLVQEPKSTGDLILQPQHRSHVCVAAATLLTLQAQPLMDAIKDNRWNDLLPNLGPFLFIVALLPLYLFLPFSKWFQRQTRFASPQTNQALFATAILFAAVHSSVWPTPIPLFVLGFGLGWLALRTRSIVPSIVVHALFNGIAVIYQRLGGMG